MDDIRFDEIRVLVKDDQGNEFSRDWRATADRRDAIRWTIESGDLPYTLTGTIVSVTILTNK